MAELPFFYWNAAYRHVPFPGLPRRKTSFKVFYSSWLGGKTSRGVSYSRRLGGKTSCEVSYSRRLGSKTSHEVFYSGALGRKTSHEVLHFISLEYKTSLGVGFTIDIMGKDSRYGYLCFLSKCCESPQAS